MKVLIVANGYPPRAFGGVELYAAGLAPALASRGHDVYVLCADGDDNQPDYRVVEERAGAVHLYRLINNYKRIRSFGDLFADPSIEEAFQRLLDRIQPDLVHFNHLIKLSARLPLITTACGLPSLFTAHDFWSLCQRIYLHDWRSQACPGPISGRCYPCVTHATRLQRARTSAIATLRNVIPLRVRTQLRRLLAKGDYFLPDLHTSPELLQERYELFREALEATGRIVTPSEYVKQIFVNNGYRDDHFDVLPLGMSLPQKPAAAPAEPSAPLRFAFVGALLPLKGAEVLVRAFMATPQPNIRLTLYGRDDIVPAFSRGLRRRAARDRRIRFAGSFEPGDVDRVYEETDVLVIPSMAHESFSLVAREALLRGKPVIASSVGALPEVVKDGINGFLTPPGDIQALAALLSRVADRRELLTDLELPGPVSILSVEQHVDRLLTIYERCRALPS